MYKMGWIMRGTTVFLRQRGLVTMVAKLSLREVGVLRKPPEKVGSIQRKLLTWFLIRRTKLERRRLQILRSPCIPPRSISLIWLLTHNRKIAMNKSWSKILQGCNRNLTNRCTN